MSGRGGVGIGEGVGVAIGEGVGQGWSGDRGKCRVGVEWG